MSQQILIALLLIILQILHTSQKKTNYRLEYINDSDSEAKCIDGTIPTIYVKDSKVNVDGKKVLLTFKNGGFAHNESIDKTYQILNKRRDSPLGSSDKQSQNIDFIGIFSDDKIDNPYFYDYTNIIINYCDGSLFIGDKQEPIYSDENQVWIRGQQNLKASLSYIKENYNLAQAETVVISGTSSGGLSTFIWIDYINDYIKSFNADVQVMGIPDAGFFYNYKKYQSDEYSYLNELKALYQAVTDEYSSYFNEACQKHYEQEPWQCLLAQNLVNFIKTPLLIVNSSYDYWNIKNVLKIQCIHNNHAHDYYGCDDNEVEYIEQFHDDSLKHMIEIDIKYDHIQFILSSCVNHDNINNDVFTELSPENSIYPFSYLTGFFIESQKLETSYIDKNHWTDNQSCTNVRKYLWKDYHGDNDGRTSQSGTIIIFNFIAIFVAIVVLF